jgi:protein ImuA
MAALRQHIARLENAQPQLPPGRQRHAPWTFDVPAIDQYLPPQGLARYALHDISPSRYGETPAAMGLALSLGIRRLQDPAERRPLLWCRLAQEAREHGTLYGHGLEALGLARQRFITVTLNSPIALLWTMEEALKSGALALVIGDATPHKTDLTATRRLSLAAASGKSAGLLVFTSPNTGLNANATASHSRWLATSQRSRPPPFDPSAPGHPAWMIELTRARGGRPGTWTVEWQNAPHRFNLVSGLSDRSLLTRPPQDGPFGAAQGLGLRAG